MELFTGSYWEELKVTCWICNIQHSDKLMTFNQDYFSCEEVTFYFVLANGKCEFFPYSVAIFEARKAGNIGTFHLAKALK